MSESAGIRFVKENWWLLIVLAIVIAGAVVLGLRGEDPEPPAEPVQATRPAGTVSSPQVEIAREKPAEMARKQIAIYEEQVKNDPEHEDTVPRLHAAANLYKNKLLDYETAAVKYQILLTEYPEFEMNKTIYFDLEVCFNELGDDSGLKWLYELIIEREAPVSNEAEYAKYQLGIIDDDEARAERVKREVERAAERAASLAEPTPEDEESEMEEPAPSPETTQDESPEPQ